MSLIPTFFKKKRERERERKHSSKINYPCPRILHAQLKPKASTKKRRGVTTRPLTNLNFSPLLTKHWIGIFFFPFWNMTRRASMPCGKIGVLMDCWFYGQQLPNLCYLIHWANIFIHLQHPYPLLFPHLLPLNNLELRSPKKSRLLQIQKREFILPVEETNSLIIEKKGHEWCQKPCIFHSTSFRAPWSGGIQRCFTKHLTKDTHPSALCLQAITTSTWDVGHLLSKETI